MRDVWGDKLVELGATDPRTIVLDGDLGNSTKVDKFAKAHPERFFQMGIAEQNLVGAAAGLAASVMYRGHPRRCLLHAPSRSIHQNARGAEPRECQDRRLVLRSTLGAVGKTHLDVQDLAIMRAMPDMTVLSPADEAELISMMDWAQPMRDRCTCGSCATPCPTFSMPTTRSPRRRSTSLREGTDVAMVSNRSSVSRVLAASVSLRTRRGRDRGARAVAQAAGRGCSARQRRRPRPGRHRGRASVMGGLGGLVGGDSHRNRPIAAHRTDRYQ